MPVVYVLESLSTGKRYTGFTAKDNPLPRLADHNAGKVRSTRARRPWKLIYHQNLATVAEARQREIYLKSGTGREWLARNFAR